jgi:hypothetical protein
MHNLAGMQKLHATRNVISGNRTASRIEAMMLVEIMI